MLLPTLTRSPRNMMISLASLGLINSVRLSLNAGPSDPSLLIPCVAQTAMRVAAPVTLLKSSSHRLSQTILGLGMLMSKLYSTPVNDARFSALTASR